jgi:tetratricopeptide (TPR) repeat protein
MSPNPHRDAYGLGVSTSSSAAAESYRHGVGLFLTANAGADLAFEAAIAHDPDFALAHAALARTHQVYARMAAARAAVARACATAAAATAREQSHIAIIADLVAGKGGAALPAIKAHLQDHPRDVMVLAPCAGVFGLFGFSGRAGREQALLDFLSGYADAYGRDGWFNGAIGFALIETGAVAAGLKHVERALAENPRNANAAHVRAHAYYEAGEARAGLAYLNQWNRDYDRAAALHCHLHWHEAIWSLELGNVDRAFAIYHDALHPGPSWGPPLNTLTDASSFLFRAELAGHPREVGLWQDVSRYAVEHFPVPGTAFADVHAALAHAMAADAPSLSRITATDRGPAADIVAALARAFDCLAKGDWNKSAAIIGAIRDTHERIGGSRAQRDLVEYAHAIALERSGHTDAAHTARARRRAQNHDDPSTS